MFHELQKATISCSDNEILRFIRQNFVENEISGIEWMILEEFVDFRKPCNLLDILTIQICERIEEDEENEVFMKVTRYIELDPFTRQLNLKKTVKVIPFYEDVIIHRKSHRFINKL